MMTYEEAVTELKRRYDMGERNFEVSPDVYEGYLSGLTALTREGGRPNQDKQWLAFKAARVTKAAQTCCNKCGKELQVADWPFCPHGRGIYGVQDDSIPGGLEITNGLCNADGSPRKYYSRTEINAEAKKRGLENHVQHIGSKGGDKSKHTVRWV